VSLPRAKAWSKGAPWNGSYLILMRSPRKEQETRGADNGVRELESDLNHQDTKT
jgi:hypothetical protein